MSGRHDLAIVGMSCRFPGAAGLGQFWELVLRAEPQFRPVPEQRWDHTPYLRAGQRPELGYSYSDRVAFLDEVDEFAAPHFRVSARRAQAMDPQQRMLLELSREAVQDAGWEQGVPRPDKAGVFFALSNSEYAELTPDTDQVEAFGVPGNLLNMAATTVSQHLDLGGTSFTVDAACSAGLVALEQAAQALRSGSCDVALVGGAYLNLVPHSLIGFSQVGALSHAGVCRPFDERADGFVLGEGAAVLAIRPVADAITDGDRIYAVLRGIGSANDGRTDGPMTPRAEGQLLAMRRAYDDAGDAAADIAYLEAHGTATTVGDAIEIESISSARTSTGAQGACRVGAVKALVGHGLTVSGLAGLLKTTLAVHHGVLPPQPETRASDATRERLASAGLQLSSEAQLWPETAGRPRAAALNSFGFGGTNVHLVLTQAPPVEHDPRPAQAELFVASAGSRDLLGGYLEALGTSISDNQPLPTVARTLARRAPLPARVSLVARTHDELRKALQETATHLRGDGPLPRGVVLVDKVARTAPEVAFVYPGQGTQAAQMLADVRERFPVLRDTLTELAGEVRAAGGPDLNRLLYGSAPAPREELARTDRCQPLLGATSAAMTRQLAGLGVLPQLTVGHSVGEFAAGAAAGVLDDVSVARVLVARGRSIADDVEAGIGGMLLVQGEPEQVAELIAGRRAWTACFNHPRQVTISAPADQIDNLVQEAKARSLPATRLAVSHGFHSPLVAAAEEATRRIVADVPLQEPSCRYVSSVSGALCQDPEQVRQLWASHASAPVRFVEAAQVAYDAGARLFVQLTGGRSLLSAIRTSLPDAADCTFVPLTAGEPDECRTFLSGLGALWAHGIGVDVAAVAGPGQVTSLPHSPLVRRRYWTSLQRETTTHTSPATAPTVSDHSPVPLPAHTATEDSMNDVIALMREQVAVLQTWQGIGLTAPNATSNTPSPAEAERELVVAPVASTTPPDSAPDRVRATVLQQISAICGIDPTELADDQSIIQDLGFDSLLFTELVTRLGTALPGMRTWPADAPRRPTIGEVVAVASGQTGSDASLAAPPAPAPEPPAALPLRSVGGLSPENGLAQWSSLAVHEAELEQLDPNPFFLEHEGLAAATSRIDGREVACYSSYNYLGLSGCEPVREAVTEAVGRYGSSVSASRFLSGERTIHRELETELADLLGTEDAVVMVSGHATNNSVIGHLIGPEDLVVHDELAHDSILQGCYASGATRRPFAHNDPEALDAVLTRLRGRHRRALVIIEGVYSMDGDVADLPALIEVKQRHGAVLMVDEAHSIGTIGPRGGGVGDHFGVDRSTVDLWAGTISKSLASCGGYVGGSHRLVEYLKYTVPGFVYSVGITPPNAAAALAAIRTMRAEPERLERLRDNAQYFADQARAAGLDLGPCDGSTPVVPCVVGDSKIALALADALLRDGVSVNPIMYPAVPEDQARLRFFITASHSQGQLAHTVSTTARLLQELRSTTHPSELSQPASA